MDSTAFAFRSGKKYCHNGGMAFAPGSVLACLGVHDDDHGPVRPSPETAVMQVKMRAGAGSEPFGGSDGLACLMPERAAPARAAVLAVWSLALRG